MREPYESLLGQYRSHWHLWPFLEGEDPDFVGIAASDPLGKLSSGELIMCQIALAFWNGDRAARIADLANLDRSNRRRVCDALEYTLTV